MWWMVLLYAETTAMVQDSCNNIDGINLWHKVANKARRKLIKDYGVNLDTLSERAQERAMEILEAEEKKERRQKQVLDQTDKLLKEVKDKLK